MKFIFKSVRKVTALALTALLVTQLGVIRAQALTLTYQSANDLLRGASEIDGIASDAVLELYKLCPPYKPTLETAVPADFKVTFNGEARELSQPMLVADGRTYIPLRSLSEDLFGATVDYDNINKIIVIQYEQLTIEMFAGANMFVVNGEVLRLDTENPEVKIIIKDGRIYLPLRAIVTAFNSYVSWDNESRTVHLGDWASGPAEVIAKTLEDRIAEFEQSVQAEDRPHHIW